MFKPIDPGTISRAASSLFQGRIRSIRRFLSTGTRWAIFLVVAAMTLSAAREVRAQTQTLQNPSIVRKLENASERMEMIVNTSRILTLDQKIPQAQVNNPDVLQLVPLSPNQIQVSAKKPGITQVNLWTEDKKIYTVDVVVFGDARELAEVLKSEFPNASFTVTTVGNSVRISGVVDQPEHVPQVIRIAEEYYPKVINNITVSGVQQVLLHVKVMEVSRTKLRKMGFDFAQLTSGDMVTSGISGLLPVDVEKTVASNVAGKNVHADLLNFQVFSGDNSFFGLLEAMREDKMLKILAEPNLVTISGRPASFLVGGSVPTLVPQSLGTVTVEYKKYGTQLDFVPIVLGDGMIRLEVRPKVSDINAGRSIQYQGYTIYAFDEREVETGVEMKAGQTLAIAGLIQNRIESQRRGLPWLSEIPYLGVAFRRDEDLNNEIELLILVTPELVEPLNPEQLPPCGPGMFTTEPNDCELYMKGFIEVPRCGEQPGMNGGPCQAPCGGEREAMPGMVTEPQGVPEAAGSSVVPTSARSQGPDLSRESPRTAQRTRYNRPNPSVPTDSVNPGGPKPLPGFKGSVGYGMLR
ncbi:MAG TPA: pilus assembly protein N-terminal domain-containing protein [Thermoguttaceae bacterium]|nr:pilus assembly protein N-terminal domain-containing protein [Thermoguttaceae bacterium]